MTAFWILITGLVSAVLLVAEHYFPWQLLLGRPLPKIAAYVMGVLALIVPLSVLLGTKGEWYAVAAVWSVVSIGGVAVMVCHLFDGWLDRRLVAGVAEREARILRPGGQYGADEA